jgi:hypothetical protein
MPRVRTSLARPEPARRAGALGRRLLDKPEVWQSFVAERGTVYDFQSHEFDWFLAELTPEWSGSSSRRRLIEAG